MRILNVLGIGRGRAAELLPHIIELQEAIGSEDFTFLLTTEPEQPPFLAKLDERLETFSWLRDQLASHGIRSGVLAQTTVGHAERGQPRCPATFQRMIGHDGSVWDPIFCPLDPEFHQHLSAAIERIAAARPAFILIDDDFRLAHGDALSQGCFCPLHLDLLAEMHGVRVTRKELLAGVAADSVGGRRLREQWRDVEHESLLRAARVIREAIDRVDSAIPAGLCATHSSRLYNDAVIRALAGRNRPFLRIANAVYGETTAKTFPDHVDRMLRQRRHVGDDVEVLTEADTYPQHGYSVSAKKLSALMTTTVLTGIDGFKAWVVPTSSWQGGENPQFVDAYARLKPIAAALEPIAKQIRWRGAAMPIADDEPHRLPWSATTGKTFVRAAWAEILGRLSFPHIPGGAAGPLRAVSGVAAAGFTVEQWREFLTGAVLLDGAAAQIVTDLGLAELIGVSASRDDDFYLSFEHYRDISDNGSAAGLDHASAHPSAASVARLSPTSDQTRVLGDYIQVPWRESGDRTVLAPSATIFTNRLGGRVAVYAAALDAVPALIHFLNPRRRAQLQRVLSWLAPDQLPISADAGTDLYLLAGHLPNDDGLIVYALNLQADRIATLPLATAKPINSIDRLDADGHWAAAEWTPTPDGADLVVGLDYLDQLILRVRS